MIEECNWPTFLLEDRTHRGATCVSLDDERKAEVGQSEERSGCQMLFQRNESVLSFIVPGKSIFAQQYVEWPRDLSKALDKATIEAGET